MDELTSMAKRGARRRYRRPAASSGSRSRSPLIHQWRLLADEPGLAPQAVEECMRYSGAVRGTGRFASTDIEYRNVLFPECALMIRSSAGPRSSVWDDAARFDIRCDRPVPQLTFGSGVHFCMGAFPARAELRRRCPSWPALPDLAIDGEVNVEAADRRHLGPLPPPSDLHADYMSRATIRRR